MNSHPLFLLTLLLLGTFSGYAQPQWNPSDDSRLQSFIKRFEYLRQHILHQEWEQAESQFKNMDSTYEDWKKRGLENDPKLTEVLQTYKNYKLRVETRTSYDPATKTTLYVQLEKGDAKKGGTLEKPAKFLWRVLKETAPGNEILIAGPIFGQLGCGSEKIEIPHLTLRGGYSSDFSQWNPIQYPTRLARSKESQIAPNFLMLEVLEGIGTVIDGLVFDQSVHNTYDEKGLVTSPSMPLLQISQLASGQAIIRNCVFINGSEGGLDIKNPSEGGKMIVENCLFLNCVRYGVNFDGGASTEFVLRNNTFALIHAKNDGSGRGPGSAIILGYRGKIEIEQNLFVYCDFAVDAIKNKKFSLKNNVGHFLTTAAVHCAISGSKIKASFEQLEEMSFEGELENNQLLDPQLPLEPLFVMKYLKNNALATVDEHKRKKEIAKIEPLLTPEILSTSVQPETKEEPKSETKEEPKEEKKDPFGNNNPFGKDPFKEDPFKPKPDPFAKKPPQEETKTEAKKEPDNSPVPYAVYNPQIYPFDKAWIFPQNQECTAGAKTPSK